MIGKHANSITLQHALNFQRKLVMVQLALRKIQECKAEGLLSKFIVEVAVNNKGRQADKIDVAMVFDFDE